jgi:hypothetical protein
MDSGDTCSEAAGRVDGCGQQSCPHPPTLARPLTTAAGITAAEVPIRNSALFGFGFAWSTLIPMTDIRSSVLNPLAQSFALLLRHYPETADSLGQAKRRLVIELIAAAEHDPEGLKDLTRELFPEEKLA